MRMNSGKNRISTTTITHYPSLRNWFILFAVAVGTENDNVIEDDRRCRHNGRSFGGAAVDGCRRHCCTWLRRSSPFGVGVGSCLGLCHAYTCQKVDLSYRNRKIVTETERSLPKLKDLDRNEKDLYRKIFTEMARTDRPPAGARPSIY